MTTTQTAAPAFIAPDTYTGHWTREGVPAGARVSTFLASEIAAFATEGVMWDSFGTCRSGTEGFGRSRYVADATGALHVYDANGRKVIVFPADRRLRILAK